MMKRFAVIATLGVLVCVSVTTHATAGQMFDYTFSDGAISVSGTLTADPNGDGSFTAVAGTANVTGLPGSGTATFVTNPNAPGLEGFATSGNHYYDDQLFPGASALMTDGGVLFLLQNGDYFNIYSNIPFNNGYSALEVSPSGTVAYRSQTPGTFTLTSVPEPSSLAMLGIATVCLAGAARRAAVRPRFNGIVGRIAVYGASITR